jgi:hypothetical protein
MQMATNEKSDLVEPSPTVRTHLITALYIMDEKGRHIYNDPTDKTTLNMSVGLWPKDWDRLRLALMDALFLLCDE